MNSLKRAIIESEVGKAVVSAPGVITRRYLFPPDFIGFVGHFPGYPILPAMVQLLMALTCAEELEGCTLEVDTINKAKFLMEIRPSHEILLNCKQRVFSGMLGVEIQIYMDDILASSISMTFKEKSY
jgi:3-hydroxyacyl-[acyl-carrier-protein] dehydratase